MFINNFLVSLHSKTFKYKTKSMKTPLRIIQWQESNKEKVKAKKQEWYRKNKEGS